MQCLKPEPELITSNFLISQLAETTSDRFVDRDPTYFSLLLSLLRNGTVPSKVKNFDLTDALLPISSDTAAAGATDFSGLQIINLRDGSLKRTLDWENATRSGSTVQAVDSSDEFFFTSFEFSRRNSNSIMVYDLNTLNRVAEIGHNGIFGADLNYGDNANAIFG